MYIPISVALRIDRINVVMGVNVVVFVPFLANILSLIATFCVFANITRSKWQCGFDVVSCLVPILIGFFTPVPPLAVSVVFKLLLAFVLGYLTIWLSMATRVMWNIFRKQRQL